VVEVCSSEGIDKDESVAVNQAVSVCIRQAALLPNRILMVVRVNASYGGQLLGVCNICATCHQPKVVVAIWFA
jgi:hypothetical protein